MARQYAKQKRGQMVTIHGFAEMAEMLTELENRGVDEVSGKLFDECCDIVRNSMDTYAQASIPADLAAKQSEFKVKRGNVFMYAYGFDRNKNPDDFMKACYLNYGTPNRSTSKDGLRVMVGGNWVTLGRNRGKVEPRGFISNAKRSAAQKMNARKRAMLKELMGRAKK